MQREALAERCSADPGPFQTLPREGGDRFRLRAWDDPGSSPGQGLERSRLKAGTRVERPSGSVHVLTRPAGGSRMAALPIVDGESRPSSKKPTYDASANEGMPIATAADQNMQNVLHQKREEAPCGH